MGERERRSSRSARTYALPRPEPPTARRHSPAATLLVALASFLGFLVLVAAAALASYQAIYGGRIPLGVQVLDMDVGGLEPARARDLLSDNVDAYLRTPLLLRYDGREWRILPAELGASFDVEESIAQALSLGAGGIADRLQSQGFYLQHPQRLGLAFILNDVRFQQGAVRLATDVERPPQDAAIRLAGGEVALSPSRPGIRLDRAALQERLAESMAELSAAPVDLPVQAIPAQVQEEDLAPGRDQIQGMLSASVAVKYGDQEWTLDRIALSEMLSIRQGKDVAGRVSLEASIDPVKAEAWARGISPEVDRAAQDVRVVLTGGKISITNPGNPGVAVEPEKFGGVLNSALGTGERSVDLPVATIEPAGGGELERLGLNDRLAEASTSYAGTLSDRIHNVRLGAERINGRLIPPGGVYSMAEALGAISGATGYRLGFAIVGQDTVLDVGGGLSQLTTTVFKAAFAAGFPILQRTTHAYRIRRYEPILGVEATIYPPAVDLKFRNDTDRYVMIDARTDAGNVYIAIYGTRPNREVSIEGPIVENVVPTDREVIRQESPLLPKGTEINSEVAEDGIDVTVYRVIKVDGKEVRRERFFARFRPSHNVVLVGTRE